MTSAVCALCLSSHAFFTPREFFHPCGPIPWSICLSIWSHSLLCLSAPLPPSMGKVISNMAISDYAPLPQPWLPVLLCGRMRSDIFLMSAARRWCQTLPCRSLIQIGAPLLVSPSLLCWTHSGQDGGILPSLLWLHLILFHCFTEVGLPFVMTKQPPDPFIFDIDIFIYQINFSIIYLFLSITMFQGLV